MSAFIEFPKLYRFNREVLVTEKIDGTNAQIVIDLEGNIKAGSRSRYITPEDDNFGFAKWVQANKDELVSALGPGQHFGEWWGSGIQRGYSLPKGEKRFSLFNTARWNAETKPACCHVVPVLWRGMLCDLDAKGVLAELATNGSLAAPGFMNPEGIVIFHTASGQSFKMTIDKNDAHKGV